MDPDRIVNADETDWMFFPQDLLTSAETESKSIQLEV
jgi:hypothetical protein